ncbi:MAG: stage II sporulation protein E, partial [Clostridia bacterium]
MMEKTEIFPYQRLNNKKRVNHKQVSVFKKLFGVHDVLVDIIAFMLGRAAVFSGFTPFGLPFYAATFTGEIGSLMIGLSIVVGIVSAGIGIMSVKYIAAMVIFTVLSKVSKTNQLKQTFFIALFGFLSLFIAGIPSVMISGLLLYDILLLLFESFICFVMIYIFRRGAPILRQKVDRKVLSNEETISLSILMGLIILGFTEIHFPGGTSLRNILCIFVLLIFSLKHGAGIAASTGVVIGLISSMSSPGMTYIIGSFAFCGLVSGIFRTFGKAGVSLGFILANAIMTIYINGSTEVLINIYDILIAVAMLIILPEKVLEYVGDFLNKNTDKLVERKAYSHRMKEITVDRLNSISKSFERLASTFNHIAEQKMPLNNRDVATLFDQVADRVCKDCGLCLNCWEREFHNTYQAMFKTLEKLEEKGNITEHDMPDYFVGRCIRLDEFISSINNMFEIYKVNLMWANKVGESRGLVSQQLQGVSRIISGLANEITIDVQFDEEMENEMMLELDKVGIAARAVTVLQNTSGKYEVEISFKACGGIRRCHNNVIPVLSKVIGRKMTRKDLPCSMKKG